MPDDQDIPCPACGFLTLEGAYGSYVICDLCGWEDDHVQLANPACGGGANSESLIEAQAAALSRYPLTAHLAEGARRDPRWRPLNDVERLAAAAEREEKYWKNRGIVELEECYWMKSAGTREQ
jgi:Cysteine-rich CPCC